MMRKIFVIIFAVAVSFGLTSTSFAKSKPKNIYQWQIKSYKMLQEAFPGMNVDNDWTTNTKPKSDSDIYRWQMENYQRIQSEFRIYPE